MTLIELVITLLPVLIWIGLLIFRGAFFLVAPVLEDEDNDNLKEYPTVCAVIPARNEADLLGITLQSVLCQNYPGTFNVVLVDDNSSDGTGSVAFKTAQNLNKAQNLHLINALPLAPGWSGKLWAIKQGISEANAFNPEYYLLADADIKHDLSNLKRLVTKAVQQNLDLASVMVRLRCESFWERLLVPAFVFFFQKLYPFGWVNNPNKSTAAAAGGCILIRRDALERIGGIESVKQALIDDCALANAVKNGIARDVICNVPTTRNPIWLGLSSLTHSLRQYNSLETIWDMVARTAYTQLNYSLLLLVGTLLGMTLVYLTSPVAFIFGLISSNWLVAAFGLLGWLLMTLAYCPIINFYRCSPLYAFCLPVIAFLYTLMTVDSALRHWQGRGGAWKGRVYEI
jgi:hopene-associated glycosyltransferase HpnB